MAHLPQIPDRSLVDRIIDGAMQEACDLSWGAAPPRSGDELDPASMAVAMAPNRFPSFQVLKEVRSGGQAVVYLGVEEATERRVAIKAFRTSTVSTPKDRYRFEREVEALKELCHPGIARILGANAAADSPYIVMEYIPGWNLDEYFREHDLSVRETMRMFLTIVQAIHAAHQKGVIHRDIKPSNIRVDHNAEPHVFDFGLAKIDASAVSEATMTESGQFLGTLYWASPEQAEGRHQHVDLRTDVYSLGMVLYHMLTGQLPFETSGSFRDALNRIATAVPAPLRGRRRGIDDDVDTIVLKCLEKDPARRYESATALGEDVERWLDGSPILAKRDSWTYVTRKFMQRHRAVSLLGAGIVCLLLSLVAGVAWHQVRLRQTAEADSASMLAYFKSREHQASLPFDTKQEEMYIASQIRDADNLSPGCEDAQLAIRQWVAVRAAQCGFHATAYAQQVAVSRLVAQLHGEASEEYVQALATAAHYALDDQRPDDALRLSDAAIAASGVLDPTATEGAHKAWSERAWIALTLRRPDEALCAIRQTESTARRMRDVEPVAFAGNLRNCAELFFDVASLQRANGLACGAALADAARLQEESLRRAREACGKHPLQLAHFVHSYAVLLRETGKLEQADSLVQEAIRLRTGIDTRTYDAVYLWASVGSLGVVRTKQGRFPEAESLLLEAVHGLGVSEVKIFRDTRRDFESRLGELHEAWALFDPTGYHDETALYWRQQSAAEPPGP